MIVTPLWQTGQRYSSWHPHFRVESWGNGFEDAEKVIAVVLVDDTVVNEDHECALAGEEIRTIAAEVERSIEPWFDAVRQDPDAGVNGATVHLVKIGILNKSKEIR